MDSCSSCDKAGMQGEAAEDPRVTATAEKLAFLLVETAEYQEFARASRAVQFDAEVGNLVNRMNEYPGFAVDGSAEDAQAALQERMEALPVVQAYRQAEAALRALFGAVDGMVSTSAGVDFAANAASACG